MDTDILKSKLQQKISYKIVNNLITEAVILKADQQVSEPASDDVPLPPRDATIQKPADDDFVGPPRYFHDDDGKVRTPDGSDVPPVRLRKGGHGKFSNRKNTKDPAVKRDPTDQSPAQPNRLIDNLGPADRPPAQPNRLMGDLPKNISRKAY
jgi:hypothetical protein